MDSHADWVRICFSAERWYDGATRERLLASARDAPSALAVPSVQAEAGEVAGTSVYNARAALAPHAKLRRPAQARRASRAHTERKLYEYAAQDGRGAAQDTWFDPVTTYVERYVDS